ncbi:hypothetical protein L6E12_19555 [Actinokineospora sp. PR83]|uniref:hypothetical protein n=1 Tax=Actinokineospora sp. PR83 TaxID=2884908 RepID=UPI001F2EFF60|nr:hypothetical protein [Actinokineospora sp. PR83]MCG8917980.1 hypothetical protein [Actinokineospora sp. PR83]
MKLNELADWLDERLRALDHDEITEVVDMRRGVELSPDVAYNHVLIRVNFANGGTGAVQVMQTSGPGIPDHRDFQPPKQGW